MSAKTTPTEIAASLRYPARRSLRAACDGLEYGHAPAALVRHGLVEFVEHGMYGDLYRATDLGRAVAEQVSDD
jgi:hypothetical protein